MRASSRRARTLPPFSSTCCRQWASRASGSAGAAARQDDAARPGADEQDPGDGGVGADGRTVAVALGTTGVGVIDVADPTRPRVLWESRLLAGNTYIVRVRLYWADRQGDTEDQHPFDDALYVHGVIVAAWRIARGSRVGAAGHW